MIFGLRYNLNPSTHRLFLRHRAAKIAALLDTSLDYLVGHAKADLDKDIADKILAVQLLPSEERDRILFTLAALVRDAKSRFAYAS